MNQQGGICICTAPNTAAYRRIGDCPVCKQRRRFVVTLHGWYSSQHQCCGCGTTYEEDYGRQPTKTKRASEIAKAKAAWKAVTMTRKQAYRADYAEIMGDDDARP